MIQFLRLPLSLAAFGACVLLAEVVWQFTAFLLGRVREHAA